MSTLVILPGLDGTALLHAEFIAALGNSFDAVRVMRYPGDQPLDYHALEQRVRRELPAEGPVVVLGESFSGPLAIAIAADPPANLVGLVLSTTFARAPVPMSRWLAPFARFAPVRGVPVAALAWVLLGRWRTASLQRALRDALTRVDPAVLRFRAGLTMRVDVSALLARVRVPTLYLQASEDRLLAAAAHRSIAAAVAGCAVVQVAGPHLLLQAAPRACAEEVCRAARRCGWL